MIYSSLLDAFESLSNRKQIEPDGLDAEDLRQWTQIRSELEGVLFQRDPELGADRREHIRVPVPVSVRYWTDNELKDRYIQSLGEGGLFIPTVDALPVGSKMDLEVSLVARSYSLKLSGEVVWVKQEGDPAKQGMGIQFVDLALEQKVALYNLVNDRIREQLLERRLYTRLDSRLAARVMHTTGELKLSTADLGAGGMFVATQKPLPLGERVKVVLPVPGCHEPARAVATVVRSIAAPAPGLPAGMGLQFSMISQEGRQAIVDYMVGRVTEDREQPRDNRRSTSRIKRRIRTLFTSNGRKGTTFSRDISVGGLFLQTLEPPAKGADVHVTIEHPETLQLLPLSSQVVRVVNPDPAHPHQVSGAGVAFSSLDPEKRALLRRFLKEFVLLEGRRD